MKRRFRSGRFLRTLRLYAQQLFLLFALVVFFSCNQSPKHSAEESDKKETYYCPMHPEVEQGSPGKCDKCGGMELVKKGADELLNTVLRPVNTAVLSSIKTVHPEEKAIPIAYKAQGFIDYDERTTHSIASRFNGRIEKLYVKFNFQHIAKGERVFDIYSADLVTAQHNLLFLLNNDPEASELIDAAKQKLRLLGMTDEQVDLLSKQHRVQNSVPVFSKWTGHIHEVSDEPSNVTAPTAQNMNMGGSAMTPQSAGSRNNNSSQATPALKVKEGMYVTSGQTVFTVVDASTVAVKLQIKSADQSKIHVDQKVMLEIDETPKMSMTATISFIEPIVNAGSKTVIARAYIDNSGHKHKVGTLVTATIMEKAVNGLWLPATAIVDLGVKKIAWVKIDEKFVAREVQIGTITKDFIQIVDGVTSSDEVALEGHYLTDSEGFIKADEE